MPRYPSLQRDKRGYYYGKVAGHRYYLGTNRKLANSQLVELARAAYSQGQPRLVSELIALWIEEHPGRWHAEMLDRWDSYEGETQLARLDHKALARFATSLGRDGLAPQTIRHMVGHASRVCDFAVDRKWLRESPDRPRLPKPLKNPRDVDLAVLARAIAAIKSKQTRAILAFIVEVGCRPGEAIHLEWSQVRLDAGVCILGRHKMSGRTTKPRTIYLTPAAQTILAAQPHKHRRVFLSSRGSPYSGSASLRSRLRKAGITPYQLRHTRAQAALDAGMDFGILASLLGHSDLRTVGVYAQVRDRRVREAAQTLPPLLATPATQRHPPAREFP